jgi:hypothetical protein
MRSSEKASIVDRLRVCCLDREATRPEGRGWIRTNIAFACRASSAERDSIFKKRKNLGRPSEKTAKVAMAGIEPATKAFALLYQMSYVAEVCL